MRPGDYHIVYAGEQARRNCEEYENRCARAVALKRADPELVAWQIAERIGLSVAVVRRVLKAAGFRSSSRYS